MRLEKFKIQRISYPGKGNTPFPGPYPPRPWPFGPLRVSSSPSLGPSGIGEFQPPPLVKSWLHLCTAPQIPSFRPPPTITFWGPRLPLQYRPYLLYIYMNRYLICMMFTSIISLHTLQNTFALYVYLIKLLWLRRRLG